ncbi:exo-alpha-sialidase [Celerinatantimonas sp. MCCC 1A17872]|uniref:exo-alpha-sialidase n=1 Tax=Celerinatantimonas sp. MCCC 1A17872 TaxID=3177514 RepID=UPI0038CAF220
MNIALKQLECVAKSEKLHLAFTDLICFSDTLWLAYRQASSHHRQDGVIVVKKQTQCGWTEQSVIRVSGDLRDPKFSISPDGNLLLNCALVDNKQLRSIVYQLEQDNWQQKAQLAAPNQWLWRMQWRKEHAFGFAYQHPNTFKFYQINQDFSSQLMLDNPLNEHRILDGYPNETGLCLDSRGKMFCLLRRDGKDPRALLGQSEPPYQSWQWQTLNIRIGGPVLTLTKSQQLLAVVRLFAPFRTSVCQIDINNGEIIELLALPSSGDTSYAGMAWMSESQLQVSYYSSHEGPSAIYLAQLKLS